MAKVSNLLLKSLAAGIAIAALVVAAIFALSKAGVGLVGAALVLSGIPSALFLAVFMPRSIEARFNAMIGSGEQGFAALCLVGAIAQLLIICVFLSYRRLSQDVR